MSILEVPADDWESLARALVKSKDGDEIVVQDAVSLDVAKSTKRDLYPDKKVVIWVRDVDVSEDQAPFVHPGADLATFIKTRVMLDSPPTEADMLAWSERMDRMDANSDSVRDHMRVVIDGYVLQAQSKNGEEMFERMLAFVEELGTHIGASLNMVSKLGREEYLDAMRATVSKSIDQGLREGYCDCPECEKKVRE